MRRYWRFAAAALLLLLTAIFLQARSAKEVLPAREALASLPHQLGPWVGTDVAIPQDALDILGAGDFLLRVYRNSDTPEPYVDLFIAYFSSQRSGDSIHSPKNCLPERDGRRSNPSAWRSPFPGTRLSPPIAT